MKSLFREGGEGTGWTPACLMCREVRPRGERRQRGGVRHCGDGFCFLCCSFVLRPNSLQDLSFSCFLFVDGSEMMGLGWGWCVCVCVCVCVRAREYALRKGLSSFIICKLTRHREGTEHLNKDTREEEEEAEEEEEEEEEVVNKRVCVGCVCILCIFFLNYTITDFIIDSYLIRQTNKTIADRIIWWLNINMRYLTLTRSSSKYDLAAMLLTLRLLDSAAMSLTIRLLI